MDFLKYSSIVESILFVSGSAVSINDIAKVIECDKKTINLVMNQLIDFHEKRGSGFKIIKIAQTYQMVTSIENFDYIEKLYKIPQGKVLTQTLLETLAIITYKQPITKSEVEEIRGVNASHSINRLIEYGLVVEKGRLETAGKPILFGTSNQFLRHFGYDNLQNIPKLE